MENNYTKNLLKHYLAGNVVYGELLNTAQKQELLKGQAERLKLSQQAETELDKLLSEPETPSSTRAQTNKAAQMKTGINPTGISPTALHLHNHGRPVTVESWLDFNFPDGLPKPIPAEILLQAEKAVEQIKALQDSTKA